MQMTMTFRTFNISSIEDVFTAMPHRSFTILFITIVREVYNKFFTAINVRAFD